MYKLEAINKKKINFMSWQALAHPMGSEEGMRATAVQRQEQEDGTSGLATPLYQTQQTKITPWLLKRNRRDCVSIEALTK